MSDTDMIDSADRLRLHYMAMAGQSSIWEWKWANLTWPTAAQNQSTSVCSHHRLHQDRTHQHILWPAFTRITPAFMYRIACTHGQHIGLHLHLGKAVIIIIQTSWWMKTLTTVVMTASAKNITALSSWITALSFSNKSYCCSTSM